MKNSDIMPIAEEIDTIGYHSVEVWGGATFDVCMRFLNEDPWGRLKSVKKRFKKTPLQMLLRGQNIVGYKHYPDDLLTAFIEKAVKNGIDILRIFDALNDIRNMEKAIKETKRVGAHAQGTICYTTSPVHTIESFTKLGRELQDLGVDSICIKDMAGILLPVASYNLVKSLKENLDVPIQLHCHSSSGMSTVSYLKAIEAGIDVVDCAIAPLALYTSQPAVETISAIIEEMGLDGALSAKKLEHVAEYFENVSEKNNWIRRQQSLIDTAVITHQIPGGMVSNLISQLEQQNALDHFEEVLEEIPKVRREFGYPPLVTPTSQIVGTQAVFNVILKERYKIVPNEVFSYFKGLYGKPPGVLDETISKKVLKEEVPIHCRPADLLEPCLERCRAELDKKFQQSEEDVISYGLFPEVALKFFEWRADPTYPDVDPPTAEKIPATKSPVGASKELDKLYQLLAVMEEADLEEISIEEAGEKVYMKRASSGAAMPLPPRVVRAAVPVEAAPALDTEGLFKVTSPMMGSFYRSPSPQADPFIREGDTVEKGQVLCIVEAMKLMNEITSEVSGKVIKIMVDNTGKVTQGQELVLIKEAK